MDDDINDPGSKLAPFWVVWNPAARNPLFRHSREDSAVCEARRLAAANPDNRFIVLQSVMSVAITSTEFDLRPSQDDIPF